MKRQRGVVLLVGLVLLLMLGLLGASALHDAQLQARLSGDLMAATRAFEQAESVLVEAGTRLLSEVPLPCLPCRLPSYPDVAGDEKGDQVWQAVDEGFYLLQNLGDTTLAAHTSAASSVTLVRVTAVSRQARGRRVLEAVYAFDVGQSQAPRRITWRQR
ncbi:hypothetical protein G7009_12620 [Pseudomonas capeferrum]|uniref:hypothetical protein n=1 Tax=Pseudomonas capeferrum TaxID=1495066 RepID=UPI0015E2EA1E|nr:hypothetical protein [Pseudomonas capeferrum]MBA1202588.1 hypothetical protein [Pseudomonas capeferrum]